MGKLTHTVKGPITSFRSADKADIESLKLHFLPKQEGSGDPSPTNIRLITGWTGCNLFKAKKNLIDVSDSNNIYSALEQTNGTFINTTTDTRDDVQIYLEGYKIKNGNYTLLVQFRVVTGITSTGHRVLSFTVPSSCEDITHFCIKHNGRARDFRVYFPVKLPVGAPLCCSFDITGADVKTVGGFSFNNVQLQVGSESDLESYEGGTIPITFPVVGKNKFNPSTAINYDNHWSISNGVYSNNYTDTREAIQLTVQLWKTSGSYLKTLYVDYLTSIGRHTLTFTVDDPDGHFICLKHNGKKKDFILLAPWTYGCNTYTFSVDVLSNDPTTVGGVQLTNIQLEVGDTATAYEPYSSGNTLLGGYIDPVNGEIWKEYEEIVFDGSDADTFTYVNTSSSSGISRHYYNTKVLDRIVKTNSTSIAYSDSATPTSNNFDHRTTICYYIGTPTNQVSLNIAATECDPTAESFNSYLQNHPVHLVYKLATPVLVATFDPTDLQTYLDYNNFWSDMNDDTEVEYCFADRLSERKLIMNTPHIESASGTIASFNTDMKAPVKELKAYFTPVQEGTGNPSPQNVRPIRGRTKVGVNQTGKNIINLGTKSFTRYKKITLDFPIKAGTYIFSAIVESTDNVYDNSLILFSDTDTGHPVWSGGMFRGSRYSKTVTFSTDITHIFLYASVGYQQSAGFDATWTDMQLELASSVTSYEPFIQGNTSQIIFPASGNLMNPISDNAVPFENQSYSNYTLNDGIVTTTGNVVMGFKVKVNPSTKYTFSFDSSSTVMMEVFAYETEPSVIHNNDTQIFANNTNLQTFTTPSNCNWITCGFYVAAYGITVKDFKLCEPSMTIYSGYIDLIHGKLYSDWAYGKISDYAWSYDTYNGSNVFKISTPDAVKDWVSEVKVISDVFKTLGQISSYSEVANREDSICRYISGGASSGENRIFIKCSAHTTVNAFLAEYGDYHICYKLATPIEYDLTPQQIKTLKGTNNIWSDANGNIEVKYWTH